MPKATSSSSAAAIRSSATPFQNAQVLRRNQACHQCRRRKLKCDAKRPCSTCVRSHAYAAAHASPGTQLPSHPECTFDEISELNVAEIQDAPKNRFERLENRISELEALLREKDQASSSDGSLAYSTPGSTADAYTSASLFVGYTDNLGFDTPLAIDDRLDFSQYSTSALDDLAGVAALIETPGQPDYNPNESAQNGYSSNSSSQSDFGMHMINPGWPRNLPTYSLLRHLVDAFFTFTPLAGRMFHMSTFLASLSLPPTHPKFPLPAILHAMCALGSMYTASITPPPFIDTLGETFAETQIKSAKAGLELSLRTTSDLFGSLQAQIIVALWYWYNARWSEACVSFSISLRYAVPCGLNVCPPFESISSSNMARSCIISPAANVVEDEMRRNTFWVAYMTERHFAAINNFAMFLDDEDVCQMLPVRGDQFEQGTLVPPRDRQWSHEPGIVEKHLEERVDSFILHVKATMLLSKVKTFNGRYKYRRHLGDPATMPDPAGIPGLNRPNMVQASPAFVEIDRLIGAFLNSFPPHLKDPLANGVIDCSLLTAISSAHFAIIILHEAHARIGHSACISSGKILNAARGILNLLYQAYSTSHNLALLGVFPMVCWFAAGRVLIRFLRSAIEAKSEEHIASLRTEVDFIRSVISQIGESVPHARQYGRMLNDYLVQTCGKEYAKSVNAPTLPLECRGSSDSPVEGHGFQELASLNAAQVRKE